MARISARLTAGAASAWDRCCTNEGVTLTAMLEALGRDLGDAKWKPPKHVVDMARQIDRERRSR